MLGNLRGGAMKIGQLASFVDVEFLPPEYRAIYQEKLADLRDSAPTMDWAKVKAVLEDEWDEPIEALFSEFDHEALAAASIGQVHRAVLADGRRVAVKVQYPEIADALESDMDLVSVLVSLGKVIAPGIDPRLVAGELRERVLEELDFELEGQNQRTFARAYRGHPFIHVPEVVTSLSRRRVLVTEWVDGIRFERDPRTRSDPARPRGRDHRSLLLRFDGADRAVQHRPAPGQLSALPGRADGVPGLRQHGHGRRSQADAQRAGRRAARRHRRLHRCGREARLRARPRQRRPRAADGAGAGDRRLVPARPRAADRSRLCRRR